MDPLLLFANRIGISSCLSLDALFKFSQRTSTQFKYTHEMRSSWFVSNKAPSVKLIWKYQNTSCPKKQTFDGLRRIVTKFYDCLPIKVSKVSTAVGWLAGKSPTMLTAENQNEMDLADFMESHIVHICCSCPHTEPLPQILKQHKNKLLKSFIPFQR